MKKPFGITKKPGSGSGFNESALCKVSFFNQYLSYVHGNMPVRKPECLWELAPFLCISHRGNIQNVNFPLDKKDASFTDIITSLNNKKSLIPVFPPSRITSRRGGGGGGGQGNSPSPSLFLFPWKASNQRFPGPSGLQRSSAYENRALFVFQLFRIEIIHFEFYFFLKEIQKNVGNSLLFVPVKYSMLRKLKEKSLKFELFLYT